MSKYEPIQCCKTCKHLDRSMVLTCYPPKAYCTLFKESVFIDSNKCIDDTKQLKVGDIVNTRFGDQAIIIGTDGEDAFMFTKTSSVIQKYPLEYLEYTGINKDVKKILLDCFEDEEGKNE